jgi:proteic killer suppression protein
VIAGFGDKKTEELFHGESSSRTRKFPSSLVAVTRRKLDMINAAHVLTDLRIPPGNRLESLKGDLAGFHSIRINDQFRIIFRFKDGLAIDVQVVDYH